MPLRTPPNRPFHSFRFLLLFSLFPLAAGLFAPALLHAAREPVWLTARSPHFTLYSAASEADSRAVLTELEQFCALFLGLFPGEVVRESPTTVVVFARDRDFRPYLPLYQGKPREIGGYLVAAPDENLIAFSLGANREQTRRLIYHEYTHLLFRTLGRTPPLWLNEGTAELFSTFQIRKGQMVFGEPIPEHVFHLRDHPLLPLRQLFAVHESSPEYNEANRATTFYAQSWALLHYCHYGEDRSLRTKLNRYLLGISRPNTDPETAFANAFDFGYDEMQHRLERYLFKGRYQLASSPYTPVQLARFAFRSATAGEIDLTLAALNWKKMDESAPPDRLALFPPPPPRAALAAAHPFFQLAEKYPQSPRPYELLALHAELNRETALAQDRWQRAADLGSTSAYAYFRLSSTPIFEALKLTHFDYRIPDPLASTWRRLAERTLELQPRFPEAWETLAFIEAFAANPKIENIEKAQNVARTLPDRSRLLLAFAIAHWRLNGPAAGLALAQPLIDASGVSPDIRALAQGLKQHIESTGTPDR